MPFSAPFSVKCRGKNDPHSQCNVESNRRPQSDQLHTADPWGVDDKIASLMDLCFINCLIDPYLSTELYSLHTGKVERLSMYLSSLFYTVWGTSGGRQNKTCLFISIPAVTGEILPVYCFSPKLLTKNHTIN